MAKPTAIIAGDTFLDWRTRYNILLGLVPEVIESAATDPVAADDAYEVGAIWVRLDTNLAWMLVHTTGASDAVWTALGTGLLSLVGDALICFYYMHGAQLVSRPPGDRFRCTHRPM